jgi:hypothetical protein
MGQLGVVPGNHASGCRREPSFPSFPHVLVEGMMAGAAHRLTFTGLLGAIAIFGVAHHVSAQPLATLPRALTTLSPNEMIWVTTTDGVERQGTLTSVSDDAIVIRDGEGITSLARGDIRRIEKKDGITDGVVRGAIIGGLSGGIPAALFIANYGECPCEGTVNFVAAFSALGAGIGVAVGAAGDALLTRRVTLYGAPAQVALAPSVTPRALGVYGTMRW